jgi:hypothetical protein
MKTVRVNTKDKSKINTRGWQDALVDAQSELSKVNLRRNQLRHAIQIIQKKVRNAEPWPATQN